MDEDNSNYVEAIDITDDTEDCEDKPIMGLFKRLIGNTVHQNTVLTNSQIIDILSKEFDIDISKQHDLETDIYVNVLKKFLKEWPQWDDFDQNIQQLKATGDDFQLKNLLNSKYVMFKNYLRTMLNIAEPIAKDTVKNVEETIANKTQISKDTSDVILEVNCTRSQLNQLFFRHPHPELNRTIFNIDDNAPSRISIQVLSAEAMINWFNCSITFNLPTFYYKRDMVHELTHTLVNKKLRQKTDLQDLKSCFEEKAATKFKTVSKQYILDKINNLLFDYTFDECLTIIEFLFNVIRNDLYQAPLELKMPGTYRRYMNKYPYVRHLYTDVEAVKNTEDAEKYSLQLDETICPRYQFTINKCDTSKDPLLAKIDLTDGSRIYIECKSCSIKLSGLDMVRDMQQHFLECHNNEPDWQCTNCNKTFRMANLADMRWSHKCEKTNS